MWQIALLVLLVLVLGGAAFLYALSFLVPKPTNLGVTDGKLAPCPGTPNCVCSQATDAEHAMKPWTYTCPDEMVLPALKKIVGELPRATVVTATGDYLRVEFTSAIFRFVDDAEFFIDRDKKVVHFRSASRAGRSDLGVNRKRMAELRQKFFDNAIPVG